jgi:hypothetical protein
MRQKNEETKRKNNSNTDCNDKKKPHHHHHHHHGIIIMESSSRNHRVHLKHLCVEQRKHHSEAIDHNVGWCKGGLPAHVDLGREMHISDSKIRKFYPK